MASVFAGEFLSAYGEVEATFGEAFLLKPMTPAVDRNAPAQLDQTRQMVTITGVWHDAPANPQMVNGYDPRTDLRPGTMATKPRVDFGPDRIPAGVIIRAGDLLQRTGDGRVWRITSVEMTRFRITRCEVNMIE